eukprot:TRINITY_DN12670_c12_g1_i1.p1 TRINITY_DN12670_c12_g1~~TRINITY_DN12670_c12_g1_i1.p1  ORF type:complete len:232 (+),score=20.06 TRINITY_DN12670_c12_g1_i1:103-798(+)
MDINRLILPNCQHQFCVKVGQLCSKIHTPSGSVNGIMGAPLDPIAFVSQPTTVLRLIEFIFAIIVFGVISDGGFSHGKSVFNQNDGAANFGIAVGVMSFLASSASLIISFLDKTSSMFTQHRALIAKIEVAIDGFFALMFFVAAIVLAANWSKVDSVAKKHAAKRHVNAAHSAIVFSFFSWLAYCGSLFFSVPNMSGPFDDDYEYAGQADPVTDYQEFTEEEQVDNQPVPF